MPTVEIEGVGLAEFPDEMSQDDISAVIKNQFFPSEQPTAAPAAPSDNLIPAYASQADVAKNLAPTVEKIKDWANKPLLPVEHPIPQQEGLVKEIAAGTANAAKTAIEGLSTPMNVALLPLTAVKSVGRLAGAIFGGAALSHIPEQLREAEAQTTVQKRLEGGLGVLTSLLFGYAGAKGAVGGRRTLSEQLKPAIGEKVPEAVPSTQLPDLSKPEFQKKIRQSLSEPDFAETPLRASQLESEALPIRQPQDQSQLQTVTQKAGETQDALQKPGETIAETEKPVTETTVKERIDSLFTRQRQARSPESASKEQLRTADKWLEADRDTIRTDLLDFSKNLPLDERAKFLPAITSALRRPSIFTRDPDIMYRRAEDVLNRMTEKVYDVRKSEVSGGIEKLLTKVEESPSITVTEKQAIRERGKTFNALKDKMSVDMLEHMQGRMKEIEQTGRDLFTLDQTMKQERVNATLREIKEQGTRKVDLPEQTKIALGETESAWQRRIGELKRAPELLKHFNLALTPIDWMIQTFDKAPRGAIYRTMKVPVDVRYGEWLDSSNAYKQRLSVVSQKHKLNAGNFDRIYANAELRQEGGEANLKALGFSEKEINSARTLTRPELEYLRESDKINNELFPVLQDVLSKSFNQEIQKVEGYFPRQRDWDYYNTLSIEEGKFAKAMNRTNTEKGFTISRVGATTKNVTNAHEVMMNHIDDVLYHIKLGPEIRRIADVVKSNEFAESTGTQGQKVFSDWVDVLSRNGGIAAGRRIRSLDVLRKNVGVAQLAFRLTTTALQPLSLIQGMAVVSPKNMAVSLSGMASRARRDFMLKNFPEIRSRVGDDPAYSDYGGGSIRDRFARGGFKAISVLDRFAALTVGEAAYRDSLATRGIEFDITKVDAQGVQDAQLAVRKTQSSAYPKDVPLAISRGNFSGNASVDKAVFQFQNFLVNKWALLKNGALQMGIEDKSPKAGARIMSFLILGTIAEQLSREGIANLVKATLGSTPEQEKRDKKTADKNFALRVSEKAAVDLVTSMPVVSNVVGMARYEGSGVPVVDTLRDVIEGATKVATGKKAVTKTTGAIRSAQAVGALAGVPTGQAGDLAVQAVRASSREEKSNSRERKRKQ